MSPGPVSPPGPPSELAVVVSALRAAGCVAAEEEAAELLAACAGDPTRLSRLVERRGAGEPLAWLVGSVRFCGEDIAVHPGVYVPRWQSEPLAEEALERLPSAGVAVDLCTGSGAVAALLGRRRPLARVLATEIDPRSASCARANGVDVAVGDLTSPLPRSLRGSVDVVVAVAPYVPTGHLRLLARDVLAYEPRRALDGGPDGTDVLARIVLETVPLLRAGGSLLLEVGGDQAGFLAPLLAANGYGDLQPAVDEEGDVRALYCRR